MKMSSVASPNPLLTVVIPVKSRVQFLFPLLESLGRQISPQVQAILVVDPTDQTLTVSASSIRERFEWLNVEVAALPNAGEARNRGLSRAKGEFVWFIDADDILPEDALSRVLELVRRARVDCFVFGWSEFGKNLKTHPAMKISHLRPSAGEQLVVDVDGMAEQIFQVTNPAAWNKVFSRELIANSNLTFGPQATSNDLDFTFSCLARARTILFSEQSVYFYRRHSPNGLQARSSLEDLLTSLARLAMFLRREHLDEKFSNSYQRLRNDTLYWLVQRHHFSMSLWQLFQLRHELRGILLWKIFLKLFRPR